MSGRPPVGAAYENLAQKSTVPTRIIVRATEAAEVFSYKPMIHLARGIETAEVGE